jgi:predicted Zn-dependent protease
VFLRLTLILLTSGLLALPQAPKQRPAPPAAANDAQPQEPPEEDLSPSEKRVYVLNPLQAAKEMKIGEFYMKKGSWKAAARRFEEATRWDPNSSEGFLRLGEAQAKLGDEKAARAAWEQYLKLQPDGKHAGDIRKKLGQKTTAASGK